MTTDSLINPEPAAVPPARRKWLLLGLLAVVGSVAIILCCQAATIVSAVLASLNAVYGSSSS